MQDIPASFQDIEGVLSNVIGFALGAAGIVLFILLIVGGFKFITSGGDPKAAEAARKTITSALAGVLIIILSYLILVLIKTITGVDVTKFSIFLQ